MKDRVGKRRATKRKRLSQELPPLIRWDAATVSDILAEVERQTTYRRASNLDPATLVGEFRKAEEKIKSRQAALTPRTAKRWVLRLGKISSQSAKLQASVNSEDLLETYLVPKLVEVLSSFVIDGGLLASPETTTAKEATPAQVARALRKFTHTMARISLSSDRAASALKEATKEGSNQATATRLAVGVLSNLAHDHLSINPSVSRPHGGGTPGGPFVEFCLAFNRRVGVSMGPETICKVQTARRKWPAR